MDIMFLLAVVGGIVVVSAVAFAALVCIAVVVSSLAPDHDHEHFDYEDIYPDKADKHHK